MRFPGSLLVLLFLLPDLVAQSGPDFIIKQAASRLKTMVSSVEGQYELWFTEDFFKEIPREKLLEGLLEKSKHLGKVQRTRICRITSPTSAELELIGEGGKRVRVTIRVEPAYPNRFQYVMFDSIDLADDTWEKFNVDLQKFPGDNAVSIWKLTPAKLKLYSRNASDPMAVGSSFKLLVLNALADEIAAGKRQWKDVIALREEGRSLPSGILQDWPLGSPLTLHTLATMMIARSDNTAADHLMLALGRENIEKYQTKAQVQYAERNRPYLRTGEMFKLKLILPMNETNYFTKLNEVDRLKFLPRFDQVKLNEPRYNILPHFIDQIEWFYTSDDMTRLLEMAYRSSESATLLPMLAITKPFDLDDFAWDYLGFKGGAETGVLNLSVLGKLRATQDWYALSLTWNRTDRGLDEAAWLKIAQRAMLLIERSK